MTLGEASSSEDETSMKEHRKPVPESQEEQRQSGSISKIELLSDSDRRREDEGTGDTTGDSCREERRDRISTSSVKSASETSVDTEAIKAARAKELGTEAARAKELRKESTERSKYSSSAVWASETKSGKMVASPAYPLVQEEIIAGQFDQIESLKNDYFQNKKTKI
jgi:hypothetical protein